MKTKMIRKLLVPTARRFQPFNRTGTAAVALLLLCLLAARPVGAQVFPPQGDDSTFSMGVFRITVDPAFYPLVKASGALFAYPGYNTAAGELTSPLCIDNSTTIGRSGPHARPYTGLFPIPIGLGSWDSIANYGAYPVIPSPWSTAASPTEEVLTEVKSFMLLSSSPGAAGQHCPPDPRVPTVP